MTARLTSVDAGMRATYDKLAETLRTRLSSDAASSPLWVCIAGGPGSGKSTLAAAVAKRLNDKDDGCCVVLPMDGLHYSRAELCKLDPPDAASFLPRRGAPWTFDAEACYKCLSAARRDGTAVLPTYSRELSDPVPNGVELLRYK